MASPNVAVNEGRTDAHAFRIWSLAPLLLVAPLLVLLCTTLWRAPMPLSEGVAIFEDVQQNPPASFLIPAGSYYRPLFYLTLSAIWHSSSTMGGALASIKLLHIVPVVVLIVLFVWHLRPTRPIESAAAIFALSVLIGSTGFLGNLEIPLSYTIVGMPIALATWILMERDYRMWHGPVIVLLALIAIGFKEQGLVVVPLIIAAWWAGAPGVGRATVVAVVVIALAYVALRFGGRDGWPPFEQDIGLGFTTLSTADAEARFGAFPLWIYAYNSVSTIGSLLFAEPTNGVFGIVRDLTEGDQRSWEVLYLLSSCGLTAVIAWWGLSALRHVRRDGWSPESRAAIALVVSTLACGALSFDYSRDRLNGMAVVFYALAAFFAIRTIAQHAIQAPRRPFVAMGVLLLLLACGWQLRATYTLERTRQLAMSNRREWITALQRRREEFADRRVYLNIMERMSRQGAEPNGIARTLYPRWFLGLLGE